MISIIRLNVLCVLLLSRLYYYYVIIFYVTGCRLEGCYFHYCQCLFRKVLTVGLKVQYSDNGGNNTVKRYIKRHMALALIPVDDVQATLAAIREERPALDDHNDAKLQIFDE